MPVDVCCCWPTPPHQLKTRIVFAREGLKELELSYDQKLYLAEEAARAGCQVREMVG